MEVKAYGLGVIVGIQMASRHIDEVQCPLFFTNEEINCGSARASAYSGHGEITIQFMSNLMNHRIHRNRPVFSVYVRVSHICDFSQRLKGFNRQIADGLAKLLAHYYFHESSVHIDSVDLRVRPDIVSARDGAALRKMPGLADVLGYRRSLMGLGLLRARDG